MIVHNLYVPAFLRKRGITPNERGGRVDVVIHGADTETYHGRPMSFQFYSEDVRERVIVFVNAETATREFFRWVSGLRADCLHVVYCHNLDFDLPEFLWGIKEKLITAGGEFEFTYGGYTCRGVYGKPTFMRITSKRRQVLIVDSFLWYQGSLAAAGELFCPDLPKLKRPANLGSKLFTARDSAFVAYAIRDAEIDYHIGKAVQKIHAEFDIKQSVSLAHMAATIFRHGFLEKTIPQPSREIISASLAAYHGGKNNVAGQVPAWHLGITSMDISSAYPYAMSLLPSMHRADLYKRFPKQTRRTREVEPLGVYYISGTADDCDWPCLFAHNFEPLRGRFSGVWVSGYELNEALRAGEVQVTSIRGHYYAAERDNDKSALASYVKEFYGRKQAATDPVLRHMWKISLNGISGKFIQTRKASRIIHTDIDKNETQESLALVAGGLFHPFIANAVTAQPRVQIHIAEHAHRAIHTATDGIFTYSRNVSPVMQRHGYPRSGLGALTVESRGDLLMLRNKCYILYSPDGSINSQAFKSKRIKKYALHGFQGSVFDLERLVATNRRKYAVTKPNRLRESLKRGLTPNEFLKRDKTLKIGQITVAGR